MIFLPIENLYASTTTGEWERLVKFELLQHPISRLLMQDPLTARSYQRPRGYAGDAKLLDMVYFPEQLDMRNISPLGMQLFRYTARTSLSIALIERIRLVASLIDETANNTPKARVLSVAAGHCREAEYSQTLRANKLARFLALDHDSRSLEIANHHYGTLGIETTCQSVTRLLKANDEVGEFDLIYSAGLYDYLSKRFAQKLTKQLFNLLAPGGRLVLMNIDTDYKEIGYMESFMNWSMVGRSALDLLELANDLGSDEHAVLNLQKHQNVSTHFHILEIIKT